MLNSTFNPGNSSAYDKSKVAVDWLSATGTVTAGSSANIDLLLSDDMLYAGLQLLASGAAFGDTVTLQIVCVTGVLANGQTICAPNTVLNQFGTSIGVCADKEEKFNIISDFPAKLQAGLTIRSIYTSIGTSPVNVITNHKLLKVLI